MTLTKDDSSDQCPFCIAGWPVEFCRERPGTGCDSDDDGPADTGSQPALEAVREAQEAAEDDEAEVVESTILEGTKRYKDARSTGRKRAAKLYPIQVGQVCDWAWHKRCGGGIQPIVGCTGRPAEHIHHGPDKSTFSNEPTNISLVCTYCHNRWHGANDPYYSGERPDGGEPWLPVVPEGKTLWALSDILPATKEEVFKAELEIPVRGKDKG